MFVTAAASASCTLASTQQCVDDSGYGAYMRALGLNEHYDFLFDDKIPDVTQLREACR